jgi:hypothetical protein
MKHFVTLLFAAILPLLTPAAGQSAAPMVISPATATLVVGQSQSFQAVDRSGHLQAKVSWTISGPGISRSEDGGELLFIAPQAGEFRITARAGGDSADASVKVLTGRELPLGSAKWSAPAYPGCTLLEIVPAVPSDSGIDVFESDNCEDGTYLRAFTADGIQKWRHKISGRASTYAVPLPADRKRTGERSAPGPAARLQGSIASFCDRVLVGSRQSEVRDLLASSHVQAVEEPAGHGSWLIEEQNSQCMIWFDSNFAVTRKRKVLVAQ